MQIAYTHMNIFDLHSYNCDLVYTFDEAFLHELWKKIVQTFTTSPCCKFLNMFKAAKADKGYMDMQKKLQEAGLTEATRLC